MTLHAVIVTYRPHAEALRRLVDVLQASDARVIVVDNTPRNERSSCGLTDCETIDMGGNAGIAAAQNAGIRAALAHGAEAVAFFDQDSTPDACLLPSLVASLGSLHEASPRPSAWTCAQAASTRPIASIAGAGPVRRPPQAFVLPLKRTSSFPPAPWSPPRSSNGPG